MTMLTTGSMVMALSMMVISRWVIGSKVVTDNKDRLTVAVLPLLRLIGS